MQRLLTGIKPTGDIHIGNYFGVMRQLVALQEQYDCYIFVADVHALNQVQNAPLLRQNILEIAKAYLAVGLDPAKVCLYQQSAAQNAELATYLAASTSLGLLERAHAFKDAVANNRSVNAGLFFYPVLMAADILLYQAELVPVGEDQRQHLEIAREIAQRFNHVYSETFVVPQGLKAEDAPTVKGLDGRKMSKSYNNVIGLFDSPEEVAKKVARIVTDSKAPNEPKDPESDTIFSLYNLVASEETTAQMRDRYTQGGISYSEAKEMLTAELNAFLEPIRARKTDLDTREDYVRDILRAGAERAREVAQPTLDAVKTKTGIQ